jgi:hypothetical protein
MIVSMGVYRDFFRRRPEVAPPGLLEAEFERPPAHL